MTESVEIAELEDDPDKVYLFGVSDELLDEGIEEIRDVIGSQFDKAAVIIMSAGIDTTLEVTEVDYDELKERYDYDQIMEEIDG